MKIGMISDLHIDTNKSLLKDHQNFSSLVAEIANQKKLDYLLIGGDNSSDAFLSQELNENIQKKMNAELLFVPGNHDLWSRENGEKNTEKLYRFFVDQEESLIGKPRILSDEWAIVGTSGWYDYGYANQKKYTLEDFSKKKYRFAHWNDVHYIHWKEDDRQIAEKMLIQLEKDLESVGNRKIILMTHVATHQEFVVPLPHKIYDYFNAYLGSSSYERLYEKYKIKYSYMGHVHMRKMMADHQTTYLSACLGNKKHWRERNVQKELEKTLVTIEI